MPETSKKSMEYLTSRTKIYIGIITILLFIICIYEIKFIIPSIFLYIVILNYII